MLCMLSPEQRDLESLTSWLRGTGSIARDEIEYLKLDRSRELLSLAPAGDNAMAQLEAWIEDQLIRLWHGFREVYVLMKGRHDSCTAH